MQNNNRNEDPIDHLCQKINILPSDNRFCDLLKKVAHVLHIFMQDDVSTQKLSKSLTSLQKERVAIVENDPIYKRVFSLVQAMEAQMDWILERENKRHRKCLIEMESDSSDESSGAWSEDQESELSETVQAQGSAFKDRPKKMQIRKDGKYPCDICESKLSCSTTLKNHKITWHMGTDKLPFKCDQCARRFAIEDTLDRHKLIHLPPGHPLSKRVKCNICGKTLANSFRLEHHMQNHTLDDNDPRKRPFKCSACGKGFRQAQNLDHHMNMHAGDDNGKRPHECELCGKRYTHPNSLKEHTQNHHQPDHVKKPKKKYQCDVCEKILAYSMSLKLHKKMHLDDSDPEQAKIKKPFICGKCGKTFAKKFTLQKHMNVHYDENDPEQAQLKKPFNCEACGKSYTTKFILRKHMNMCLSK